MYFLPRLAIGTVQPCADDHSLLVALIHQLCQHEIEVQAFLSQAHFGRKLDVAAIGRPFVRHLDSWLMSEEICREIFWYGSSSCDLAIVEGTFSCTQKTQSAANLDQLCEWLDLPAIAVVDASRLDQTGLPAKPPAVCAVVLDQVQDERHARDVQTTIQSYWQVPIVGASLAWADPKHLRLDLDWLMKLARQRSFHTVAHGLLQDVDQLDDLTVAVAFDEALNCYFPDTLDLLEMLGATIYDFSPLRSDRLPDADVVYLGCGPADEYAGELANNVCMKQSMHEHLATGGRIYAEGGGLAYLAQQMVLDRGEGYPMCGVLPIVARLDGQASNVRPAELTLVRDNWLGSQHSRLRGYVSSKWSIERAGGRTDQESMQFVGHHQVVGSRLHVNFAANPELLRHFFEPVPNLAATRLQAV